MTPVHHLSQSTSFTVLHMAQAFALAQGVVLRKGHDCRIHLNRAASHGFFKIFPNSRFFVWPLLLPDTVKSTSPDTKNHDKNGYVFQDNNKNFILTNVDNSDTTYTR